jgi:hypothetical protein
MEKMIGCQGPMQVPDRAMDQTVRPCHGKPGPFVPLYGAWVAEADSDRGHVRCRRVLTPILGGHYVRLPVGWEFGPSGTNQVYEEEAVGFEADMPTGRATRRIGGDDGEDHRHRRRLLQEQG